MKILGIDTSSNNFSIAVSGDSGEIFEHNVDSGRKLCSMIIPTIKEILKKKRLSIDALDAFAVGLGPGSFTGLRIGLATIKGLAFGSKKPVIGIPTLDILARNISNDKSWICPIVDAKRDKVYTCIYENKNKHFRKLSNYSLIEIKDLIKKIKRQTIFVGDGIRVYEDLIRNKLGKKARFSNENFWLPHAGDLVILAKQRIKDKKIDNPDKLTPLYLYPKECQIKR